MKKQILLGLITAASATSIYAQPTLTTATNNPIPGNVFHSYTTDTAHVTMGVSGASVTWDQSMIVKNDSGTVAYLSCMSTPYCDSFAGSDIVMLTDSDYAYGISGPSGIEILGAHTPGQYVHLTNNNTLTHFPLTYGTTFSDTFSTVASLMGSDLYITGYNYNNCDAWGTLILPTGTYTNVLRVATTAITKDSFNVMGMPFVNLSQTETYSWYVSGFHSPIYSVTYDTAGASSSYLSEAKYYRAGTTLGVKEATAPTASLVAYPNPAGNSVTLRFSAPSASAATITVLDMTGNALYTVSEGRISKGTNEVSIPLTTLSNGLYTVRIQSGDYSATGKITVVK